MALTRDDVQIIKELLQPIYDDTKNIKRRISDIESTLENVTNKNISIIAEDHLDLSRKLDEALKVENEKELLLIRVNMLENDIKKIKQRLDQIA